MRYPTNVCLTEGCCRYAADRPCTHWLGPLRGPATPRPSSFPHSASTTADVMLDTAPDTHARRSALRHEIMQRWTAPHNVRSRIPSSLPVSGSASHESVYRRCVRLHRTASCGG